MPCLRPRHHRLPQALAAPPRRQEAVPHPRGPQQADRDEHRSAAAVALKKVEYTKRQYELESFLAYYRSSQLIGVKWLGFDDEADHTYEHYLHMQKSLHPDTEREADQRCG